jgi:hypothetical protein
VSLVGVTLGSEPYLLETTKMDYESKVHETFEEEIQKQVETSLALIQSIDDEDTSDLEEDQRETSDLMKFLANEPDTLNKVAVETAKLLLGETSSIVEANDFIRLVTEQYFIRIAAAAQFDKVAGAAASISGGGGGGGGGSVSNSGGDKDGGEDNDFVPTLDGDDAIASKKSKTIVCDFCDCSFKVPIYFCSKCRTPYCSMNCYEQGRQAHIPAKGQCLIMKRMNFLHKMHGKDRGVCDEELSIYI